MKNKSINDIESNGDPKEMIPFLRQFITSRRWELINNILENRTQYITLILEDIYQSQNASAVLRTCDCFGIQDVHVIENKHEYRINPDVTLGSNKWINLIKHNKTNNNTLDAIKHLKSAGYRIVATTPHKNNVDLNNFDIYNGKFALLFGTELHGLSSIAINNADEYVKIPMYGFTESFNISVSAAIILQTLVNKLRHSDIEWHLDSETKEIIKLDWLKKSIRRPNLLIKEYTRRKKQ